MRKLNYPLILGVLIVLILTAACINPEAFTTADPYGEERAKFVFIEGKINYFAPPVNPCPEYPWGTDQYGRDMKSLIFYGCRLTLFTAIFIAIGRLLVSLPLAIYAAYGSKAANRLIRQFGVFTGAFPIVILTMLFVKIQLTSDFFKEPNTIIGALLVLFGWSKMAGLLKEKVEGILNEDFIEGEIAIGKNRLEIALQNIVPHLIPSIVVMFFLEVAAALLVLSQIGVFGIVMNGGLMNADGEYQLPYEIDWASLLVASQWFVATGRLWLVLYPAAAFAISIIGFNLMGEGLRMEFEKRNSRVISWIRGIPSFLSLLRLAYELKHMSEYRSSVTKKLLFYGILLLLLFFPQLPSAYRFETTNAFKTMEELSKPEYRGRRAGSSQNEIISDYLAEKLAASGIQPFEGSFVHNYPLENAFNVKEAQLTVSSIISGQTRLEHRKDYYVTTPVNISGKYKLKKFTLEDLGEFPFQENEFDDCRGKFLLVDVRGLNGIVRSRFLGLINSTVKPAGVLYIDAWESQKLAKKGNIDSPAKSQAALINIAVSSNMGDTLLRMNDMDIELTIMSETYPEPENHCVVGYLPGSDETLKDEIIIIGSTFDCVGDDRTERFPASMEAGGPAMALETAGILGRSGVKPKRTVIFAFWDGTNTRDRGSKAFLEQYFKDNENKNIFYIELKNFGSKDSSKIILDTTRTLPKALKAQEYIKVLKKNARRNELELVYGKVSSPVMHDMLEEDINAVIIDTYDIDETIKTPKDNMGNIEQKKLKKPGQTVLDALVEILYGGAV